MVHGIQKVRRLGLLVSGLPQVSSHDNVHNDHRIEPGDLHWTVAGKGIVHTQPPEGEHARLNGLPLFFNLPQRLISAPSRALNLRSANGVSA